MDVNDPLLKLSEKQRNTIVISAVVLAILAAIVAATVARSVPVTKDSRFEYFMLVFGAMTIPMLIMVIVASTVCLDSLYHIMKLMCDIRAGANRQRGELCWKLISACCSGDGPVFEPRPPFPPEIVRAGLEYAAAIQLDDDWDYDLGQTEQINAVQKFFRSLGYDSPSIQ